VGKEADPMRIRTSIWIEDDHGQVVYGLGRQRILQAIRDSGSMMAAAERLEISYRGLWARLHHSERRLGFPLVDSKPGRGKSGGTKLTPKAVELLERYEKTVSEIYAGSERAYNAHLRGLLHGDGSD
jgi:molybdate transport system regulatory protein